MGLAAGFFGKHPAFGDFISDGVPEALRVEMEGWLTPTLAQLSEDLGEVWADIYDSARPLRFWIGPSVLEHAGTVRGVICSSRDAVGRRFPMVLLYDETNPAPPPIAPDQDLYEALETAVAAAMDCDAESAAELMDLDGLDQGGAEEADALWAVNPEAPIPDLLHAIGAADYARAAAGRSYWWSAADDRRSGAVWSCSGLPGASALGWLMAGLAPAVETVPDAAGAETSDEDPESPSTPAPDAVKMSEPEDNTL